MSTGGARPVDVPPGYVVGRWRVTGYLGSGSWGSVYSGEPVAETELPDGEPGQVALKFLPPSVGTPGRRALLAGVVERERRFSASADHPALIRTIAVETAVGGAADGATVLVMERAVGNVRQLLDGRPVPGAERMLAEVCSALAHMHGAGWIHGDVKPGNVLLLADGGARLADFGVTTELDGTHGYVPRLGSSDHLPPEWWSEQVGVEGVMLRPTADVWAFGVLAHQMLTGGRHPFAGATPHARAMNAQSYGHSGEGLLIDEGIAEPWRDVIRDCLAPDHASRAAFPARVVADRIDGLLADPGGLPRVRRCVRPVPAALVAVVTVVTVAAIAATSFALWPGSSDETPASPSSARAGSGTARGELRPGAAVPAQYRDAIRTAAHACPAPEVTPALIAGVLKEESGFDPDFADPATESYGIAGWTPQVFHAVAPPSADYMNPTDAIMAAGDYLCGLDEEFAKEHLPGDLAALTVAGYDTSTAAVAAARGVPAKAAAFTDSVLEDASEYGV
ncbi:serine/threonine-protein kinase [Catenulispora subtropica]|uniref:non-specific serine/threonine protein kinase n=1 Tax=Catenulispora subtropica TaxID=450798 RepID=A0ABN2QXY6_9ACTN